MKYLLDHFKPYDMGEVNVKPSSQTTTNGLILSSILDRQY